MKCWRVVGETSTMRAMDTTWKVVAKNSRTDEDEEVRGKDGGKCPAWEPGLTPDSSAACGTRRDQHAQM
jgi:hypothetical protein